MTTQTTLSATAIDVVGQYNQAAKYLVATYRTGTERVVVGFDRRYVDLVNGAALTRVRDSVKEQLVGAEQRLAELVVGTVTRASERADETIDRLANRAIGGISLFDQKTAWAEDMAIVNALRRVSRPAAKLSLRVAGKLAEGTGWLSQRVAGIEQESEPARRAAKAAKSAAKRAAKPVVKRAVKPVKAAAPKRTPRATAA